MEFDMDRKDFRSLLSKLSGSSRINRRHGADRRSALLASVGRAMGVNTGHRVGASFEALEARAMLEGSFANSILLTPDASGHVASTPASGPGANFINPAVGSTDNDFYRFTAPANDFVTVLADTSNESPVSTLNTRVQVFDSNQVLVASGTNNGQLTSGFATDGWAGFVAQAGHTYFVVVSSENGTGTPGTYTLRIAAQSTAVDIGGDTPETGVAREHGSPIPDSTVFPPIPITPILGQLGGTSLPVTTRLRQDNIVYKLVLPSGGQWDNLITFNAQSNRPAGANQQVSTRLDTRLDIYNSLGQLVAFDSDAGRINDAFTTVRAKPGDVFYIRVRSDEIKNANIQLATGPFWLVVDAIADKIALDPVTRRGSDPGGQFVAFGPPTVPPNPAMASPTFQSALYEFTAQGTGLAIITQRPTGLDPVVDGALRLIDDTGTLVAFNDNFQGTDPQITANLIGGKRYFVIVDGFDLANGTQFGLFIEANHTINNTGTAIDDHVNTPVLPQNPTQAQLDAARRQFEQATALTWGPSFPTLDADGNVQRDLGLRVTATGTGRIQGAGDTDLFQFTPQVDMLQNYNGNNDDLGTALYAGGAFDVADPNNPWPTNSRDLAIWDAQDWWFTGAQFRDPATGTQFGFQDNPNTPATNRAEIYTLFDWDIAPGVAPPRQGLTNHVLVVGGDFNLVVPTALGPVTISNLAFWVQDANTGRFVWDTGGLNNFGLNFGLGTDGPVHAAHAYDPVPFDPDGSGPLPTVPDPNGSTIPDLFVGGQFTNIAGAPASNIGFFRPTTAAWNAMGPGTNGPVFAMTTYQFDDPGSARPFSAGPPPIRLVNDVPERPSTLIVGGQFSQAGGAAHGDIATWNGVNWDTVGTGRINATPGNGNGGVAPNFDLNGPVFSLTVFDSGDPDGAGPFEAPSHGVLYIGGHFTQLNGAAVGPNLIGFGYKATTLMDTAADNYQPRLVVGNFGLAAGTAADTVFALTPWDPPDINNGTIPPVLMIGGDLAGLGNIASSDGIAAPAAFGGGTDGIVRALTTVTDLQEPGIQEHLISGNIQTVLYVGGDFTIVNPGPNQVVVNHIAQFDANTGPLGDFFEWSRLAGGVANADPASIPAATVFAVTGFDDGNPFEWDRHDRPAERLQIVVTPVDGSFLNTRVRVFDSNFNVVYGFDRPGSETIAPPQLDPSGMLDPNINPPPLNTALAGIPVWGGQTYYVEISGPGTGRYSFTVTAAAQATDLNGDGTLDDVNAQVVEEPNEGNFAAAPKIDTNLVTGDADNTVGSATDPGQPLPAGHMQRIQHITPSIDETFTEGSDLGNISTIDDTDLYYFRAEFTGTAEIRVQTIDIPDQFGEMLVDPSGADVAFAGQTATYTSHLDAALRVFRNDFEQIAYQDDNLAIAGERQDDSVGFAAGTYDNQAVPPQIPGTPMRVPFTRKDPRIVINVVAGNNYFIQVESGQKYKNGAPKLISDRTANISREIDQRFVGGSYRLLINQMPQENAEIINGQPVLDDHTNVATAGGVLSNGLATVIPIGDDPTNPATNGIGSINGVIRDTPNNPADQDIFTFMSPGAGNMTIRVSRTGTGNTLNPTLDIFQFSHETGQFTLVGQGAPQGNGAVALTLSALAGDTYMIGVTGSGGSQGAYRVDINGVPAVDDTADFAKFANAKDIPTHDFQGQGSVDGVLETRGDTDVYRFSVTDFALFGISVQSHSPTLNPAVTVYEVSEAPDGSPIFLRIGVNDGSTAGGNSTVTVPVTPNRTEVVPPPGQNRTYPYYYVLVRGADPNTDFGAYTVSLSFPPSDDHPDAPSTGPTTVDTTEYPFASRIPLDPITGQGNAVGNIEINSDTDLFVYTAPAGGSSTVVISRPANSTLRYKVIIADANGNVLSSAIAADDPVFFTATATTNVLRGVDYFIVVQPFNDPANPNVNSTDTGLYTVSVTAPPVDDYPNAGEFQLASTIPIDFNTGKGQIGADAGDDPTNPRLSPANDTDLFTFTTVRAGNQVITLTPWDTAVGHFAPRLTLFDAQGNQISTTVATSPLQVVSLTISNAAANTKYFVLVGADGSVAGSTLTGEYRIQVAGPSSGGGGGTGGSVDSIDFNNPTVITLDTRTGDGSASDLIDPVGDRDLFTFTTTAAGKVFVQLTAPNGSLLRASIRVLKAPNELQASEVAFDSDGIPGAIANVSFAGEANKQYWVVVDGLGDSTGSYTLKVNTQPVTNRLVFPEGFASDTIREFVSIINPGDVLAHYTVFLRYETGALETQVMTATINPHSRNGLTIIDGKNYQTPGIRLNAPYSVILESDQPLGATLAHYDFGHAIGDSFTETVSPTWSFARVEKAPGSVMDFIVFYNINNFDVNATLTAYDANGQAHSLTRRFGALRRGGFSINDIADFPLGVFGVTLTVKNAADSTPASVVASLSHYNTTGDAAFGLLGDPNGGSTVGIITNLAQGSQLNSELDFFNPGDSPATVTIVGTYIRTPLPQFTLVRTVAPKGQLKITGASLGLSPDQPIGIKYSSDQPIVAGSDQVQLGDADSTEPGTMAGTEAFFGDAFIDTRSAGVKYFESVWLANPTNVASTINVKLDFLDGSTSIIPVTVAAHGFAEIKLHTRPEILATHNGPTWFSMDITSAIPFVASMTHYDLTLGGGWATSGVPFGILLPLSSIIT
jgi:hypothetical protein